jgi:hypothetical protein
VSILHSPLPAAGQHINDEMAGLIYKNWPGLPASGWESEFASTQHQLLEWLKHELAEYTPQHEVATVLREKSHKWRAMSALQKAIRRSNSLLAYKSARAMLYGGAENDLWRRLAIISLEDIGLADPYCAAFASMFAGRKPLRTELGQEKLLYWLLDKMCAAIKSRDLCDLITVAWNDPACKAVGDELGKMDHHSAWSLGMADGATLMERVWFYRHMFDRWPGRPTPAWPESTREDFYAEIGLPPLLQFIAHENIRATNESLACCIPVVWQLMKASTWAKAGSDPFEIGEDEIIGATYAASYDKHVFEGKRAFKRFQSHNPEIAAATAQLCPDHGPAALERAIFYTEGAILRPRLQFDRSQQIFDDVLAAKLVWTGFKSVEDGYKYFNLVQSQLPVLNKMRRFILEMG